jgi:L-asparagine transporter-like permease
MTCIGEVATWLPGQSNGYMSLLLPRYADLIIKPVSGSFIHFAKRIIDPSLGYSLSINYL